MLAVYIGRLYNDYIKGIEIRKKGRLLCRDTI